MSTMLDVQGEDYAVTEEAPKVQIYFLATGGSHKPDGNPAVIKQQENMRLGFKYVCCCHSQSDTSTESYHSIIIDIWVNF